MKHHMNKFVIDIVFFHLLRFPPPIGYSIQHHMIKFVIDIVFPHLLRFPPPIRYSIQHHMIKFVIDIVFLHLLRFPPPIGYSIQHHVIKFFVFLVSYWFPDTSVLSFTNETNTHYQFHYCFLGLYSIDHNKIDFK
jgi:hypothetical protein